jgi:hypothetical protein
MNYQFKTLRGGKGEPLRPYTAGSDLLFTQVLDRAQPLELCWDKMKFRARLLEWIDSLSALDLGVTDSVSLS